MMIRVRELSPYALFLRYSTDTGRVHSVFAGSFNLELGGRLLHVGTDADLPSCLGISIPAADMPQVLDGLLPDCCVTLRNAVMRVYSYAGVSTLDLTSADIMSCVVREDLGASGAAWAHRQLAAVAELEEVGLLLDSTCVGVLRSLASNGEILDRHLAYLVGRGLGLTPSGDDFLLGYATALRMAGRVADLPKRLLNVAYGKTTDVSVAYFDAFARGWVNPVYVELGRAIAARDEQAFRQTVELISTIGHTSGCDALLGFVIGFSCVQALELAPKREVICA